MSYKFETYKQLAQEIREYELANNTTPIIHMSDTCFDGMLAGIRSNSPSYADLIETTHYFCGARIKLLEASRGFLQGKDYRVV